MAPYTEESEQGISASNLTLLEEFLDGFTWEKRDKRLDGLPLMSSIWPSLFICLGYLYLVRIAGPNFMRNRDAFKLDWFVGCYNSILFLFELSLIPWLSVYYFSEGHGWGK